MQADRHLRRAAAQGDDGQANDQRSHMQSRGQAHRGAHHQLGAGDQQYQAAEQFNHAEQGDVGKSENGRGSVSQSRACTRTRAVPLLSMPSCSAAS